MKKLFSKILSVKFPITKPKKLKKHCKIKNHHLELTLESSYYREASLEDKRFLLSLHTNEEISKNEIKNLVIDDELALEIEERELIYELMHTNLFKHQQ